MDLFSRKKAMKGDPQQESALAEGKGNEKDKQKKKKPMKPSSQFTPPSSLPAVPALCNVHPRVGCECSTFILSVWMLRYALGERDGSSRLPVSSLTFSRPRTAHLRLPSPRATPSPSQPSPSASNISGRGSQS